MPGRTISGAPDGALACPTVPGPEALVNAITVREPWKPVPTTACDITLTDDRTPVARATQISVVPSCALLRFTIVQDSPAPLTVAVCAVLVGPSYATKATSRSDGFLVENAEVWIVPLPS